MAETIEPFEYKLIVAGGRDFKDYPRLSAEIYAYAERPEMVGKAISIVNGGARGADRCGWQFTINQNVKRHDFPADWDRYGKRAGFIRNHAMGDFADGLLAFWDGKSRGTRDMIQYMHKLGKDVHVVTY